MALRQIGRPSDQLIPGAIRAAHLLSFARFAQLLCIRLLPLAPSVFTGYQLLVTRYLSTFPPFTRYLLPLLRLSRAPFP
jgi:hypothetical protein